MMLTFIASPFSMSSTSFSIISLFQRPEESTSYRRTLSAAHKDEIALQSLRAGLLAPSSIPYRQEPWVQSKGPPSRRHSFADPDSAKSGWAVSYRGSEH